MLCSTILTDIEDLGIYIKCLIIKLSLKVLIMTRRITVRWASVDSKPRVAPGFDHHIGSSAVDGALSAPPFGDFLIVTVGGDDHCHHRGF